jgi:hypothetical protein
VLQEFSKRGLSINEGIAGDAGVGEVGEQADE